jgi:hypothetical protein
MVSPPASTKTSLGQRLREHARDRWPQLASVEIRFRSQLAYTTGSLADGTTLPLCHQRYGGYASTWGSAIYRASRDNTAIRRMRPRAGVVRGRIARRAWAACC